MQYTRINGIKALAFLWDRLSPIAKDDEQLINECYGFLLEMVKRNVDPVEFINEHACYYALHREIRKYAVEPDPSELITVWNARLLRDILHLEDAFRDADPLFSVWRLAQGFIEAVVRTQDHYLEPEGERAAYDLFHSYLDEHGTEDIEEVLIKMNKFQGFDDYKPLRDLLKEAKEQTS